MTALGLLRSKMTLNPVLAKEVKERMRSPRAMVMLSVFLVIMSAAMYVMYRAMEASMARRNAFGATQAFAAPALGRTIFEALLLFLVIFVAFIAPGLAAGSIVGERERRTLHLLQVTLLKPRSIVLGKLGAALAFTLLLIVASSPLFSIPLVLGGVAPWEVVRGLVVIVAVALLISCLGIYMSSVARRSQFATVATYGIVLLYFVGTMLTWAAETSFSSGPPGTSTDRAVSVFVNPITALASAVTPESANQSGGGSPLSSMGYQVEQRNRVPGTVVMRSGGPLRNTAFNSLRPKVKVWMVHTVMALGFSALLLWLASLRLRAPSPRFVIGKQER